MHSDIPDYMFVDDSLVTWDYWIRVEDNVGDGYIELGPYMHKYEAESISNAIESSLLPGSYNLEVIPQVSVA